MPGGAEPTGKVAFETTMKSRLLPSASTTTTWSPARSVDSLPKIIGWSGNPAWPSMTASPGAPGTGPALYQPAFQAFTGTFITPERFTPTASTARWTFRDGMSNCAGGAVGISAFELTAAPLAAAPAARLDKPGRVSPNEGCSPSDA